MKIFPIPALRDNYIWAIVEETNCIVVDPGEASPVEAFLTQSALTLCAIWVTHRHHDHIGGISALTEARNIPIYGPPEISLITHPLQDQDALSLNGFTTDWQILAVPGHTEEHIAYYCPAHNTLFCGDTLFSLGCGRLLGSSSAAEYWQTLTKLSQLPDDTLLYCTHEYTLANLRFAQHVEPNNHALAQYALTCHARREANQPTLPTTLAIELQCNPFLRVSEAEILHTVQEYAPPTTSDSAAVFAALRAWKDIF